MIQLSYSTINELIECPHTWLCKQMGLPRRTSWQMQAGTDLHRIIQDHVSGKKTDERLAGIAYHFPIVEQKDMDEETHFRFQFNEQYSVHGYVDGINPETKQILEIKTSSKPWGIKRFYDLIQWRIYSLALPETKEIVLITTNRDLTEIKAFTAEVTDREKQKAKDWIQKGIDIIESGNFEGGNSRFCNYKNCPFDHYERA